MRCPRHDAAQHFIAVESRHHQVEHDHHVVGHGSCSERIGAGTHHIDTESIGLERPRHESADALFVIDNKHSGHISPPNAAHVPRCTTCVPHAPLNVYVL